MASEKVAEQECLLRPDKKQKLATEEAEIDDNDDKKKQKLIMADTKCDDENDDHDDENDDHDDDDEEEDDEEELDMSQLAAPPGPYDDEDWTRGMSEEILKRYEPYQDGPPIFHADPTPVDISGAFFNIIDPEKETDEYDINFFYEFMDMCHREKNLLTFDHPGDPRIGGLGHVEGFWANDPSYRNRAQIAIEEYHKLNPNANLEVQEVKCVNESILYCQIFYLTFMAKDKNTDVINKYQAALWNDESRYELGLLRDASNDRVLAIMKVKGAIYDAAASEGGSVVSAAAAAAAADNLGKAKE